MKDLSSNREKRKAKSRLRIGMLLSRYRDAGNEAEAWVSPTFLLELGREAYRRGSTVEMLPDGKWWRITDSHFGAAYFMVGENLKGDGFVVVKQ